MPQFLSLQNEDHVSLYTSILWITWGDACNVGRAASQLMLEIINSYQTQSYWGSKIRSGLSYQVVSSNNNFVGMIQERVDILQRGNSSPTLSELVGVFEAMTIIKLGFQIVCGLLLSLLDRVQGAGGQNMRDRATIRRLNMYRQKERRWALHAVILSFPSCPGLLAET